MTPINPKILISGAGIAGLTLGYWLQHYGFHPTIVEKRSNLDDMGYMIDFYGSGFDVAEKMGLLDALRARHYPIPQLSFVDDHGTIRSHLNVEKFRETLNFRHYNFMRGDLENVLYDAVKDIVSIHFNTTISTLHTEQDGVQVELSNGTSQEFALLIGADGIHSHVRNLLWGNESQFENYLGFYVACSIVDNILDEQDAFYSHVEPDMQASVYSIQGNQLATFFAFRSDWLDIHGRQEQLATLASIFGDKGWIIPQLVEATRESPNFFFDAVAQIKLTLWYKDRVALVGDACQCLTLLAGQGASMAMAGAYLLANELHRTNGDYQTAFPAYQARLQPEIEARQTEARKLANSFVPKNRFSIWMMYLFLKVAFLPGFRSIFMRQIGAKSIIK